MPKLLGIDYGEVRIGLAIADMLLRIAHPHSVIQSGGDAISKINLLIEDKGVEKVIIGLPRSLDGSEGPQAAESRRFGKEIAEITGVDIEYQDERLSSREADSILNDLGKNSREKRAIADAHQAAIILQSYLDSLGDD